RGPGLLRWADQHGDAGAGPRRIAGSAEKTAQVEAARPPVPANLAGLPGRDIDEAVRHDLEDGLQLARHLLRLAREEGHLGARPARLRIPVDPVRVEDEPHC